MASNAPQLAYFDGLHHYPDAERAPEVRQWATKSSFSPISEKHARGPVEKVKEALICGVHKKRAWKIGIAATLLVLLAVIASLIAVFATTNSKLNDERAQKSPTSSSSSNATASSSSSSTTGGAPPLESITNGTYTIYRDCPSSNGTTFTSSPLPAQKFTKHCSFLFKYKAIAEGPITTMTDSLDGCISLCAAYNALNGTGPFGPCVIVSWRTDPRFDLWGTCFGGFRPANGAQFQGFNATAALGDDTPVDSALLVT